MIILGIPMTTDEQYKAMVKDLIDELEMVWGKEKFQEWYEANIVTLRDKVYWTPKAYYIALKEVFDELQAIYDEIFLARCDEDRAQSIDRMEDMREQVRR